MSRPMNTGRNVLCFAVSLALIASIALAADKASKPPSVLVGIQVLSPAPPGWRSASYSPAMQEAVSWYLRGMTILETADPVDVDSARRLFEAATARGLPHARYGLACAIYRTRDTVHYNEARDFMEEAADDGVLEAKVGAASYYLNGIGTRPDPDRAVLFYVDALRFRLAPPISAADPIYLYRSNPVVAGIAFKFGESNGICNPPISAEQIQEKRSDWWKLLYFPRLIESRDTVNNERGFFPNPVLNNRGPG